MNEGAFDEDYDVSPGREGRRRATYPSASAQPENEPVNRIETRFVERRAAPSAHAGLSSAASPVRVPASSNDLDLDLKVRFRMRDREGASIVRFAKSTTVQAAFAAVETRFSRKLEASHVQALSFPFTDGVLDVELDDGDTWEDILVKLVQLNADGTLSGLEAVLEV